MRSPSGSRLCLKSLELKELKVSIPNLIGKKGPVLKDTYSPLISSNLQNTLHEHQYQIQCIQVFVVAVLAIFPLVPRNLSQRAFRLSLMGTACSSLFSLYSLYGKPRAWNAHALQVYFQSIAVKTKDFIYFIYCLIFVASNLCLKFSFIPILCRALEHVAKFLRHNFSRSSLYRKYLEEPCVWVESNTTTLSILSSHAEIGLGFLIISFFSWQGNLIQTFMYWQLLKLMYHAPVTASYHNNVWAKIGRIVNPLVHRYAPFLNTPISAAQRWRFR
ncbi:uncharacterized protein LOC133860449 [Alnus glutinosa]|uniref:uncharacterized protein LOC133860449 n=1 Tax=Alnus glutinosa TaxID=3517 RepID=UPI002D768F9E|nr:uncharacterized protein LOC133860449 [Alnus glutinosa]